MPPPGLHLLSEHHLVFSGLMARYRPHLMIAGACLTLGVLLLALDFTDAEALTWWAVIVMIIGAIWVVPSLIGYARSIKKVFVFDEGISWSFLAGEEFHPWEDLREIYRSERLLSLFQRQAEITLVFKKTAPVLFDQRLSDFFQLATLVEALVTQRLLPAYRQSLQQGNATFGPVVLMNQGIRINDQDFSWQEVEACAVRAGGLVVLALRNDESMEEFASFAAIPNYLILLQLLEELGKLPARPPNTLD